MRITYNILIILQFHKYTFAVNIYYITVLSFIFFQGVFPLRHIFLTPLHSC